MLKDKLNAKTSNIQQQQNLKQKGCLNEYWLRLLLKENDIWYYCIKHVYNGKLNRRWEEQGGENIMTPKHPTKEKKRPWK